MVQRQSSPKAHGTVSIYVRDACEIYTNFVSTPLVEVCAAPKQTTKEGLDLFTEMDLGKYRMQRRAIGPAYSVAGMEVQFPCTDILSAIY
jgi:hypothetical protein